MSDDDSSYQGEGPSLEAAFEDAWQKAKGNHEPPGRYTARLVAVEATNPIHTYIVEISPTG